MPATPRSILKCTSADPSPVAHQQHPLHHPPHHPSSCVRFPSSPKLSTVHFTHCPNSYDRTPITVSPNSCAMPERGCREYGSTSSSSSSSSQSQSFWLGNHMHPSVLDRMASEGRFGEMYEGGLVPPPLSSDDGSSEESDGIASPPPETVCTSNGASYRAYVPPSQSHLHSDPLSHPPIPQSSSPNYDFHHHHHHHSQPVPTDYSLSFLPHAPAVTRKRSPDKSKSSSSSSHHHHHHREFRPTTTTSFGSSWGQNDEESCLGGF